MKVIFVSPGGTPTDVDVADGESLMQAATRNDVAGIVGECGGSMMCATCHCYVDAAWIERVGPRVDGEDDMLDCATAEVRPASRLSCQIRMREALDGLVVYLPDSQT